MAFDKFKFDTELAWKKMNRRLGNIKPIEDCRWIVTWYKFTGYTDVNGTEVRWVVHNPSQRYFEVVDGELSELGSEFKDTLIKMLEDCNVEWYDNCLPKNYFKDGTRGPKRGRYFY